MKIRIATLLDVSILQLVIVMMAFNDWSSLLIVSQVIAFTITLFYNIRNFKIHLNKGLILFVFSKIGFILWGAIGIIVSVYPQVVLSNILALVLRLLTGITIIMYVKNEEYRVRFLRYLIFAGCLLCLRMLIVVPISSWGSERVGTYLSHNSGASYGYTGVTYAIGLIAAFMVSENEAIKSGMLKYFIICLFSFFSLLTGSKKQIFFLVVSIFVYGICKSKNTKTLIKNIVVIVFLLVFLGLLILKVDILYNVIGSRFISFLSYFSDNSTISADASTISRGLYLKEAWRVFLQNPIFGVGFDCFRYYNQYAKCWAENNFLEILADTGIIGLVFYYIVPYSVLRGTLKRIKIYKNKKDIQILIVLLCIIVVDFSMVSYPSSVLQFHLSFLFASSIIAKNNYIYRCKEIKYEKKC